jgi:serine/threonine protein kinase
MYSSSKGKDIQVQFTVTIPTIEPQELQFDPNPKSGADRMLIGRGGFGVVYAGHYQGQPVAIKTLHVTTAKVVKSLYEEAAVMFRLASPYTVKLQGICSDANETSLVMERMMGGSLFHLLQDESQELPWELRYRLAYEIAEGLWSLHSQEILHRDLKSLNVLLDEEKHAKITDFGFSRLRGQVTSMAPSSNKQSLGTLAYKSPELIEADSDSDEEDVGAMPKSIPYTPYSDIYAYGMILWEIATRSLPFEGLTQRKVEKRIKSGKHEKIPADCPPEFAALIKKCWATKPGQRPRTDEIVAQTKAWYEATQVPVEVSVQDEKDYNPESWYVDPEIRAAADEAILKTGQPYALLPASDYDLQKVVSAYQLAPVPGQNVKSVQVIYNPRLNRAFGLVLNTLNARQGKPAFKAHWREEQGKTGAWRQTTHQLLEALAKPHQDTNNPHVNLVPMWHATNADILPSLFETGFANLAIVDTGFFGKGIYSTGEAKYAQTVYGKMYPRPALLMNWVASFSAYPVIDGDMPELQGKGNYGNHDAHFIPVRPANPKDPHEVNFYPCRVNERYTYTEMVVFQSAQCLPRYVVELQSDLLKSSQAILDAQQKHQVEQAQKAQAEAAQKQANQLKSEQQAKEQAEKEAERIALEKAKIKQIEAEKEAAVKKAVEQSEKTATFLAKQQVDAQAVIHAEEMKQLKAKLAAMEAEAASAKAKAEQLAAEKAQVEADQKYAEKLQAEQAQKIAEQEKIQPQQTEQAQKEQERVEQQKKAAAEENKEAGTEGRIKVYSHFWKPAKATLPDVSTFLRLVAEGEQNKAEAMLKADPRLGLAAGRVTDLSKRTFKNITGLQYALWALDWNMWMMLLKYIPREETQLQAMALEENGTEHGKHFDFSQLLGAYETYGKNYAAWNLQQREIHWYKQVGGAQLLLPVHVVNEYCRPDRAFYPLPDFNQEGLPRVREVNGKAGSDVYPQQYKGGGLGANWGLVRGEDSFAHIGVPRLIRFFIGSLYDATAVTAMSEARLQQQQLLMTDLFRNKPLLGR